MGEYGIAVPLRRLPVRVSVAVSKQTVLREMLTRRVFPAKQKAVSRFLLPIRLIRRYVRKLLQDAPMRRER